MILFNCFCYPESKLTKLEHGYTFSHGAFNNIYSEEDLNSLKHYVISPDLQQIPCIFPFANCLVLQAFTPKSQLILILKLV